MGDPLLRMAGLPGMRSLGNGPLSDDGDDRIPTERYLYNTRELYDIKTKKPDADFVSNDYYGVPTLEDKIRISMRHAMGEFCWIRGFAEVSRRRENGGSQEAKEVLIDLLGFISTRVVWSVKCCNQEWKSDRNTPIIEKSLTWLKRNKLFHSCIKHISIDFDPRDEFNVPFFEDFVTLCWYISTHLPDLDSAILWLTIAEDDFQEVLKSPMRFSWVQAFRELRIGKVDICPMLTKSGESDESRRYRSRHSIDERFAYFLDFHHARFGIKSLLLNDLNNERGLITHMLTPGSKLWGYTDDIDDDAYISLQYMESWLSYADDVADDAYISLQFMEEWNEKLPKPLRFRNIKRCLRPLRLQRYQLPRQSPPNQRVPQQMIQRAPRAAFRNILPGDGWERSIWYQMKL